VGGGVAFQNPSGQGVVEISVDGSLVLVSGEWPWWQGDVCPRDAEEGKAFTSSPQ
tara:strand:+ start:1202 stop:1366 length:165 start_codon:yes stop_codon:yes gene_type:complete